MASFLDSIFLVSNCLSTTTSSFVNISFPNTNTNDKIANNKITLTTFCCFKSDFLSAKIPNSMEIPIGIHAKVPKGKKANTMLNAVKILAITKNNFLIIVVLNSSCV